MLIFTELSPKATTDHRLRRRVLQHTIIAGYEAEEDFAEKWMARIYLVRFGVGVFLVEFVFTMIFDEFYAQ